jgi:hypothetical protein
MEIVQTIRCQGDSQPEGAERNFNLWQKGRLILTVAHAIAALAALEASLAPLLVCCTTHHCLPLELIQEATIRACLADHWNTRTTDVISADNDL